MAQHLSLGVSHRDVALYTAGAVAWNNGQTFFARFQLTGWKRLLNELGSEAFTLGAGGFVVLYALAIPAFNIPYLPMMEPIVQALRDTESFGLIAVARLEWTKFEARSLEAVAEEYERAGDARFTGLHLDHVPVVDEDNEEVDFEEVIRRTIDAGCAPSVGRVCRWPSRCSIFRDALT